MIRLPSGLTLVVDCCAHEGRSLTGDLLDDLGVTTIDHLIVTHPDLDHVDGLDVLLRRFDVRLAWTWPTLSLVRDLLTRWGGRSPSQRRLAAALERLDQLARDNRCLDVAFNSKERAWQPDGASVAVIAPLPADLNASRRQLQNIVEWRGERPAIADNTLKRLTGERSPGDHPNLVSLGLVLRWSGWKILLGGDVEAPTNPTRGWRGVLRELTRGGEADTLTNVHVVSVPHHGSRHAWLDEAWDLHASPDKTRIAVITPFARSQLPHQVVLDRLRPRAETLALTAGHAHAKCLQAGWTPAPTSAGPSRVTIRLRADGTSHVEATGAARTYT